jgi:arylsulfatase A-like enzyme
VDNASVLTAVDFLPTLCALAGVPLPDGYQADGEDVGDILLGKARARSKPIYWEWRFRIAGDTVNQSPMLAVREGNWKLLMNPDRSRVELYDIPRDPTELLNLAERQPEVVGRLAEKLLAWQKTLPAGPVEPAAGKNDYRWPQPPAPPGRQKGR